MDGYTAIMRHTKIIATIGPASDSSSMLDALIAAGADIFRLNFSHGTHDTHAATIGRIRDAARRSGREVAILQDLSGPKIRTGSLVDGRPLELKVGEPLTIVVGDSLGGPGRISTTFRELAKGVHPGDQLLVSDGRIELRVVATDGVNIETTVTFGGTLGEHKGINAPGVMLPASAVTAKDVEDLRFGLSMGVDMVALSFVQTAEDLRQARAVMTEAGAGDVPLIAKLERPQALVELDDILGVCDGVMVARGDLGLEMPLEGVPRAQKRITRVARRRQIPVILATQVLESMTVDPRPTRAEVSDAANAVDDGVDAIMLADETAVGAFPARAVSVPDAVIRDAESDPKPDAVNVRAETGRDHTDALCEAAVTLAERGAAQAIAAVTRRGGTVRRLSALRPNAPIVATTNREEMARRLALYWGVLPLRIDIGDDLDAAAVVIGHQIVARGIAPAGSAVVFISISPDLTRTDANYLKIRRV